MATEKHSLVQGGHNIKTYLVTAIGQTLSSGLQVSTPPLSNLFTVHNLVLIIF